MLAIIEARLRAAMTRAGRNVIGAIFLLAAAVFLGIAGWITLQTAYGTVTAAVVLGAIFLVLGLLLIFVPVRRRVPVVTAPTAPLSATLIEAFIAGRTAGRSLNRD